MIAALCVVFMAFPVSPEAHAQGLNLTGTWEVKSDKEPGVTILKLSQSGHSVSGKGSPSHLSDKPTLRPSGKSPTESLLASHG
jgi:hypothetical protein